MIAGKEDLLEALTDALSMEKGTRRFYEFAASKAISEEAWDVFRRLCDWEKDHMRYISFLYQSLMGDMDLISYEEFQSNAPEVDTEAGISVKEAEDLFEERNIIDDTGAIILALGIEGKAYNLYRMLSGSAEDRNARVVFEEMMRQEQMHIDQLRVLKMEIES